MNRAPRVLHVLGRLDRGGVETWLMHLMRQTNRAELEMDVCALSRNTSPAHYDEEFQQLGGIIHRCSQGRNLLDFSRRFRRLLQEQKYDIVHSHVHHFSGFILREAARCGVPMRICHSHSDKRRAAGENRLHRRLYIGLMRDWLNRYATRGFACSDAGGRSLWGEDWRTNPRWRILYCGIDLRPFLNHIPNPNLRTELGIPEGATVWGHVGRFTQVKNHEFLVKLFAEALRSDDRLHLLLVGDGPLRSGVESKVKVLNIVSNVRFLGNRSDVPALMQDAMDVFVLPSLYEGLGLVAIEAQAAGLPCVLSSAIPSESHVLADRMKVMPLDAPLESWIEACAEASGFMTSQNAAHRVADSPFAIDRSLHDLQAEYYRCSSPGYYPDASSAPKGAEAF